MSKLETKYILALDQGTTSSRSILYNLQGQEIAVAAYNYSATYPNSAWVEQDPQEILKTQLSSIRDVLLGINPANIIGLGITNQRETVVAWNKETGEALAPAIVWQCRRTADFCDQLKSSDLAPKIQHKTGLTIDPYFSGSKIKWLIDHNDQVKAALAQDLVVFGTVDSWLIYNLTKSSGKPKFLTDPSNASRTMLYNLHTNDWDQELLEIFGVKRSALCTIQASNSNFGQVKLFEMDAPIFGVLGDQQSSLFGHGALKKNDLKCTFGTGAFLLKNSGQEIIQSASGLLTTVAWGIEKDGKLELTYALEGSVFIAGSLIKWLRDQLGIIKEAAEVEELARKARERGSAGLVIVPAFVGLGTPYWDYSARGAILGLTADAGKSEIAYAALEAVASQVADLLDLPELQAVTELRIDGGMIANQLFNQILADITQREIILASTETTAYGTFRMAALGLGIFEPEMPLETLTPRYKPQVSFAENLKSRTKWKKAIEKSRNWI